MAERRKSNPRITREATLPTASRLETVARVRSVVEALDVGDLGGPAQLVRQMTMNARLRAVLETRFSALTGAEQRWHPRKDNRDGRRTAREIVEDWPLIAPTPMRWQNQLWGLMTGVGIMVPDWTVNGATLRQIPRLRAFALDGVKFDRITLQYQVMVWRGDTTAIEYIDSPAFYPDRKPALYPWVIHEPFGSYSFQHGYLRSAWYSWLGHNWGQRDRYRMSEKVGTGAALAYVPHGANVQAATEFRDDVANMRSGGVVVCEEIEDGRKFDVKPFEWQAQNTAGVVDAATANAAADLVILFLGSLTAAGDLKGGASHDLASAGADITSDRVDRDAEAESATLVDQVVSRWAEVNYGDPDLAPIREVVTDPPAKDAARALMASQLSQSLDGLGRHGVDTHRLCEEMRLPMTARGAMQMQVPRGDGEQLNDEAAQPEAPAAQSGDKPAQQNAEGNVTLTPTDIATIVTVDEGRKDVGLAPVGGDTGGKWIAQHSAEIRAAAAPEIAEAASAEKGALAQQNNTAARDEAPDEQEAA